MASNSPRLYWQSRESPARFGDENRSIGDKREGSPSSNKRSSIENLKRASRVKNSSMFAREHKNEYDPTSSPMIERPLASGRPLNVQVHGNAFGGKGLEGLRNQNQMDSKVISSPLKIPGKLNFNPEPILSPRKGQTSPSKSSLSSKSRFTQAQGLDPEASVWSDDEDSSVERQLPAGKSLHRHAKSVTFAAAPPQVNEYEMTTPDPSSVASGSRDGSYDSVEDDEDEGFDRSTSFDREDSFDASLEDTDKTPVVLPEDWRFMSPAVANDDLAAHVDDPFDREQCSPAPPENPLSALGARSSPTRTNSVNSNGERRPLPPLPALGLPTFPRARSDSNGSLNITAERASSAQRTIATAPSPASITKAEIQGMGGCSMSIESRLKLMMAQDEEKPKTAAEEQREKRLTFGTQSMSPERDGQTTDDGIKIYEDEAENDDVADLGEYKMPPRISRESILRKVKSKCQVLEDEERGIDSPAFTQGNDRDLIGDLDPDTPLPSLEIGEASCYTEEDIFIKQEDDESEVDVYAIPDLYSQHLEAEALAAPSDTSDRTTDVPIDHGGYDDESHYSTDSRSEERCSPPSPDAMNEDDGPLTPRVAPPTSNQQRKEVRKSHRMSLPQFAAMLGEQDFGFGLDSYLTPSPPMALDEPVKQAPLVETKSTGEPSQRPVTPVEQLQPPKYQSHGSESDDEPRTPDSVIRHPMADSPKADSPSVPEPVATIKAPGSKLKTRPSVTPSDVQAMAEARRQVSYEVPAVPLIPERHQNRHSMIAEADTSVLGPREASTESDITDKSSVQSKRKSSLIPLDIRVGSNEGVGFGLDKEFDRVIEAQKVASTFPSLSLPQRANTQGYAEYIGGQGFKPFPENHANKPSRTQKGYLMRQNTKVVIASSVSIETDPNAADDVQDPSMRGTRSAGNSPRKPSQQTWTTEPWNSKVRRKSIRQSGGSPQKKLLVGSAPPLPGQTSNVTGGLNSVAEDQSLLNEDDFEDGAERGCLFVKVLRVKDLDLPLPKGKYLNRCIGNVSTTNSMIGERSYFALTLDNGLHCVTTSWLELGKTAPIGQEFELVVLNDLEFQLTLQTRLEEPRIKAVPESPTKSVKTPKASTFSRVFASPKKRKELEMRQQEEAQKVERQRQQQAQANRQSMHPTAWDLLHGLVAKDGSFARSYVCLKDHEANAYGKPFTVDVPCFNEWATEDVQNVSSIKSKRSTASMGVQRKAPYKIGKLELQLLFVPKPKGTSDQGMPKSMNACIRELKEAENSASKTWEGHLSQQGGDCPVRP